MPGCEVRSENTQTFLDHPGRHADVLIAAPGRSPVVVEAEYAPAAEVEKDGPLPGGRGRAGPDRRPLAPGPHSRGAAGTGPSPSRRGGGDVGADPALRRPRVRPPARLPRRRPPRPGLRSPHRPPRRAFRPATRRGPSSSLVVETGSLKHHAPFMAHRSLSTVPITRLSPVHAMLLPLFGATCTSQSSSSGRSGSLIEKISSPLSS